MKTLRSYRAFPIGTNRSLLTTAGVLFFFIGILMTIPTTAFAQLAYAHVQANGTIDHDSGNITVSRPVDFPGAYCIGVTPGPVNVAVVSLDSGPNLGGTVQAGVFFATACSPFPDAHDILVITRPQAQDGGTPGEDRSFYIIVN